MATASTSGAQRRDMTSGSPDKVAIGSDIVRKVDPNAPPALDWSFRYDGPIAAVDDRNCGQCNAAAMKKCGKPMSVHGDYNKWAERHPGLPVPTVESMCPSCDAAKQGYCHLHCGVSKALDEHPNRANIPSALMPSWKSASEAILSYVAALPSGANAVEVKAHANQDQPDAPFAEIAISVVVRR